jgi:hypothetical protein
VDITLTSFQFVYTEHLNGLLEESDLPVDAWVKLFRIDGRSNQDYWPYLTEYWEEIKSINYDQGFVVWMDENVVKKAN